MQVQDSQAILQKYQGTTIKVDPFFLKRTSFVSNQTLLKLGEYNVMCVPALLGFEQAQFLAVLTPAEVGLFAKFVGVTSTLVMAFEAHDVRDVARYHVRISLASITPLERKNVCLLTVHYKSLPAELIVVLGNFLDEVEARKAAYEALSKDWVSITPSTAELLGYNQFAELLHANDKLKVKLLAFHSKQARLEPAPALAAWEGRRPTALKLYFRSGQIVVDGVLEPEGLFSWGFSNELLVLLEDFRFRETVVNKKKASQGTGE